EFTFSLVHIGALPDARRTLRYRLPDNVIGMHDIFLHDPGTTADRPARTQPPAAWQAIRDLHTRFAMGDMSHGADICPHLHGQNPHGLPTADLLLSNECWELLTQRYQASAPESAFRDFFWTFRATHMPLFRLLDAPLPPARLYHAPGTGF